LGHAPILSILPSGDERIRPEKPLIKQDFPVHFPLAELKLKMANPDSRVTIHMAASLDGFIARKDGRVDWMGASTGWKPQTNSKAGITWIRDLSKRSSKRSTATLWDRERMRPL
jgi:hypothetical protein